MDPNLNKLFISFQRILDSDWIVDEIKDLLIFSRSDNESVVIAFLFLSLKI